MLLLLSAFFSGSETSFFSINKIQLNKLKSNKDSQSKRILKLLEKPTYLLIVILLGNTLVNISMSSLATVLVINLQQEDNWAGNLPSWVLYLIQFFITTVLLLIFGEIIPKLIAFSNSDKFSGFSSIFLKPLGIILYPVLKPVELFMNLLSNKKNKLKVGSYDITNEDIKNIITSESNNHPLEENEKEIIAGIFRFSSTEVRGIIQPRVDIVAVDENDSIDDLKKVTKEFGYSRIPVYNDSIDNIIGIVNIKDLILYKDYTKISDLVRPVKYITENTKIQTLFNQFKATKSQIAIVVDEYGGTAGLVTLEDILEELVGDILDEYDADEPKEIEEISANVYKLSGKVSIPEFNEKFDFEIDDEEYDNIADYLLSEFNHIPKKGEVLETSTGFKFTVESQKNQRINYVKLECPVEDDDDQAN